MESWSCASAGAPRLSATSAADLLRPFGPRRGVLSLLSSHDRFFVKSSRVSSRDAHSLSELRTKGDGFLRSSVKFLAIARHGRSKISPSADIPVAPRQAKHTPPRVAKRRVPGI